MNRARFCHGLGIALNTRACGARANAAETVGPFHSTAVESPDLIHKIFPHVPFEGDTLPRAPVDQTTTYGHLHHWAVQDLSRRRSLICASFKDYRVLVE